MMSFRSKTNKNTAISFDDTGKLIIDKLSEFWRQTAAQLFYDHSRGVFGANSSIATVSEVFGS